MRLDEFFNQTFLNELQTPNSLGMAGYKLKSAGYEKIGRGSFASVWGKPGEDFLVKIFNNMDRAYPEFVKLASNSPNKYFPKFKGKLIKINEKYSAVRVERLEPMPESQYKQLGLDVVDDYLNYQRDVHRGIDHNWHKDNVNSLIEQIYKLDDNQPGIKAALDLIAEKLISFTFDFQPQNVMLRGNTVVILDPVV